MTSKLKPRGAFLHIPRTGGTWVHRVLADAELVSHTIGAEHCWSHHEDWAFTVVRNPVDWWVSLWRFQVEHEWMRYPDGVHPLAPLNVLSDLDLAQWVKVAANDFSGFCGQVYKLYVDNADYVLQTEYLCEHLRMLAVLKNWKNLQLDRPRENVSITQTGNVDFGPLLRTEAEAFKIWENAGIEQEGYVI